MDIKREKDTVAIEIGRYFAIIGKDGREYKVEVLGKRVTDMDTDVYVHYEGTDKRLDEWVDMQRLTPLSIQSPSDSTPQEDSSSGSIQEGTSTTMLSEVTSDSSSRPKRKFVKDDVSLLVESLKSPSRKRSGELTQENPSRSASSHGHEHDDEEVPRVRNVEWILYAGYDIATWYYSPFPEEYQDCQRLFVCEYCLKYIRQVESFMNHTRSCKRKKPPGTVVYSKGANKIYKVDGRTNKLYCQNLSLLAKLFLDNKTLYFDIHGFHFFVLTETRSGDRADVPVGFFSKEIVSYDGYNLACILILPPFQRKSYGKLLIEFSYELTKIEGKVGSPEKPLSDLGKLGYVSYWITAILRELYPKPWPAKRILLPSMTRGKGKTNSSGNMLSKKGEAAEQENENSTLPEKAQSLPGLDNESRGPEHTSIDASGNHLKDNQETAFSLRELAAKTGIMEEDLLETLVTMGWMTHWLSRADQATLAAVKNAKRGYRKLIKFDEQQQLFDKYRGGEKHGSGQEPGPSGQQDGHDHESGLGHLAVHSRQHSRQQSGTPGSASPATVHISSSTHTVHSASTLPTEFNDQELTQEVDPVSILDMPESDDEAMGEEGGLEESTMESALSPTGLRDVAVVTLEMVKEYQDRHNIQLEPYLDWAAIDWAAYRSTLDL